MKLQWSLWEEPLLGHQNPRGVDTACRDPPGDGMLPGKGLCFGFLCVCFAVKHVLGLVVFCLQTTTKPTFVFSAFALQ